MTGSRVSEVPLAGRRTLTVRQSSELWGSPVYYDRQYEHQVYRGHTVDRTRLRHGGPNVLALKVEPFKDSLGIGGRKRRIPKGFSAKGIPDGCHVRGMDTVYAGFHLWHGVQP
jgi:hypothetical protein